MMMLKDDFFSFGGGTAYVEVAIGGVVNLYSIEVEVPCAFLGVFGVNVGWVYGIVITVFKTDNLLEQSPYRVSTIEFFAACGYF